jgi:hypothetical protein
MSQNKSSSDSTFLYLIVLGVVMLFFYLLGAKSNATYVKPYVTKSGKVVKGHVRKKVSTSPKAIERQNYSKGYYSRYKFRYKKTKKEE